MSKAVLISIRPEWCDLIKSGMKTIEVRKSRPNLDTPFKVHIYCTIHGCSFLVGEKFPLSGNGKIIGEFVCDNVTAFSVLDNGSVQDFIFNKLENSCLSYGEISRYIGINKVGYSWHISDLKIYDKPRELSEFRAPCAEYERDNPRCGNCGYYYSESNEAIGFYDECCCDGLKYLEKPPQSWCYVEECDEND